jgi:hypothetical protein
MDWCDEWLEEFFFFRTIQGPELAEQAGMRPFSRGRGVVQPVRHLGGRLVRLSKRLSPEVLTKCNRLSIRLKSNVATTLRCRVNTYEV